MSQFTKKYNKKDQLPSSDLNTLVSESNLNDDNIEAFMSYLLEHKTIAEYNNTEILKTYGVNDTISKTNLVSVALSKTMTKIKDNCFSGCSTIANVNIPDFVVTIGDYAFYECRSLSSVTIPSSVTSIGIIAFSGCTSLPVYNNIRYADTCTVDAIDKTLSTYTLKEGTKFIENGTFRNCTNLTDITIPNSVISIGYCAFHSTKLSSITIPDSVITIGSYAFYYCSSLSSITIPDSVTSIGNVAFSLCFSLSSVTVCATTPPTLGDNVFGNNASVRKIYVPSESVDLYKTATNWSAYADSIEAIPE